MSSCKFPIKTTLVVSTIILIALLAYDAKSNGQFRNSLTANWLKGLGALPVVEQAYNKIQHYSITASNQCSYLLEVNKRGHVTVSESFWEKFTEVMLYLWDSTEVIRLWINKNIPPILETISDNYVPKLQSMLLQVSGQLQSHLSTVWAFILRTSSSIANWLLTNVLTGSLAPENIQKVAIQAIDLLQKYTAEAYLWVATQIKTLIY